MTKITIEDEYGKYVVEDNTGGLNIHDMMDLFKRALLAMSFHPDTVKDGFIGKAEEYEIK